MKWPFDERGFSSFLNLWTKTDTAMTQLGFRSLVVQAQAAVILIHLKPGHEGIPICAQQMK